jgi:large subunit ribosomal protein L11
MIVMLNFLKMAKEISKVVKLQVKGGADPSPPVGPALESCWCKHHGVL